MEYALPITEITEVRLLEMVSQMPHRQGLAPETTRPVNYPFAHQQLNQTSPYKIQNAVHKEISRLPYVVNHSSGISVPGARAWSIDAIHARGPRNSYQVGFEFAHIHPSYDGSFHLTLPPKVATQIFLKKWGEPHPRSGTPMIYGARNREEAKIVTTLLKISYLYARGLISKREF